MKNDEIIAVIGSGAGGLPAATALAEFGHKVVLIERGGHLKASEIRTNSFDYEVNNTPWKSSSAEWNGNIDLQRGVGIGGSTLYYQAVMSKLGRDKLKAWGVATEFYQKYEDLVIKKLNIAGFDQPFHRLNSISSHLMSSLKKLGWDAEQASVAILSQKSEGRPSCVNCGLCVFGCLPGDKTGTNNSWLPSFLKSNNGIVMADTQAVSIELSNKGIARAVNLISHGEELSLPIKAVVVSAGALETPYLFLQSRQKYAPYGIGNENVGRFLQASLMFSQLVSLENIEGSSAYGIPVDIVVNEFESEGIRLYQGKNLAGITGPVSTAKFYANKFGILNQRQWMRNNYTKLAGLAAIVESSSIYDDGLTSGKSFYKGLTFQDFEKMERAASLVEKWRIQSGANLLYSSPIGEKSIQGSMLRGTCRMGMNIKSSAVSAASAKLHGYENIYVSDASILGQGMISDPSLTLQSLGYYYGSRIAKEYSL